MYYLSNNDNLLTNSQYIHSKIDALDLKILTYFYDDSDISISQRTALYYWNQDTTKSKRTFYRRVEKLENLGLLLNVTGKSPKFFVVTNKALSFGLINTNDSNLVSNTHLKNDKPIENIAEIGNNITNSLKIMTNSLEKSKIPIYKYFNDIFLSIIHNFLIKIPIEINETNYNQIDQLNSSFMLVSELINVRRYSKKLNINHPQGNYDAFVNIHKKHILVRLYEIQTFDMDVGFSKAIDRILQVLDAVQQQLGGPQIIEFAEISQWKSKESTGKVISFDCELANHPINHLLKQRIKFTNKKYTWKLIDEIGNKIGFDCSPRNLGKGRKREPHLEITGKNAYEKTEFLLNDMRYQMRNEIGVEKLHEVIRGVRNQVQKNIQQISELEKNQKENVIIIGELAQVQAQQKLILDLVTQEQTDIKHIVKENQSMISKLMEKLFPKENVIKRFFSKVKGILRV